MDEMEGRRIAVRLKRVLCGILSLAVMGMSYLTSPLEVSASGEKADVVGSVNMAGKTVFDNEFVMNGEGMQMGWGGDS